MKVTLEAMPIIERVNGVDCRKWKGATDAGTPVIAWIAVISPQTHDSVQLAAFDNELRKLPDPDRQAVVFDMRFIL